MLRLDELRDLVRDLVRERRLDAEVVGVTPGGGEGQYAEVLVKVQDAAGTRRLFLGFERSTPVARLREQIAAKLLHVPRRVVMGPDL